VRVQKGEKERGRKDWEEREAQEKRMVIEQEAERENE
jgi:hypothetical protein